MIGAAVASVVTAPVHADVVSSSLVTVTVPAAILTLLRIALSALSGLLAVVSLTADISLFNRASAFCVAVGGVVYEAEARREDMVASILLLCSTIYPVLLVGFVTQAESTVATLVEPT